ncbi:MAG: response regulator [Dysgonamonadaceae bacterium]|jgi:signal transduction histidine kinase/ligand-binding sensor domain-containing protein/DNA-binding response OmpR family regulator|nr:response regulator [Dysgonamonadaceae bacterium]
MCYIEKVKRYTLTLLFLLCICTLAFPQKFNRLNEDLGLSSRRCYAVCKDKNGLMWIATKLSIDRYDGHEIIRYELPSPGQPTDNIEANFVCLSPDSVVWAFTQSGFIYRYDEQSDAFVFVYSIRDFYQSYTIILNNLFFDDPNTLLLATKNGVLKLNLTNNQVSDYPVLDGTEVYHIIKQQGLYYFATKDGLLVTRYSSQSDAAIVNHILKGFLVNRIYYDEKFQRFWIGAFSNGLYVLQNREGARLSPVQQKITKPIRAIIPYSDTQLAIGVDGEGIFLINRQTLQTEQTFTQAENEPQSIGGNSVWDLFLDNQKILWVATYHGGISYTDQSHLNFENFVHEKHNVHSIVANYVNAILEDKDGDLWFGTNNGLSLVNRKTGYWQHFFKGDSNLSDKNVILTLCEGPDGKIWAGGYAFGVASIDKYTGNIKRFRAADTHPIIGTDYIYSIYKDEYSEYLWMAGIYGKTSCYNPVTHRSRLYNEESLRCFSSYDDSTIVLGLYRGLYLMDKQTGNKTSTKLNSIVNTILKDGDRCYWVGTTKNGLYYYDMRTDSLRRYTKILNGLSSNHIYAIEKDEDGYLWISTENGLNKFDPRTESVINFDKQNGLISNQFIACASTRCSNNQLLFGSADGAVLFYPSEIKEIKAQGYHHLMFTGFYLFGNLVHPGEKGSPLHIPVNKTGKITLPYNKNYFSLTFTLPNYQSSDKINYSCFLKRYDLDWSHPSAINSAAYSKMQPGKYVFMVRVYIDKQLQEERHIEIIVLQPWWNTAWAWMVYVLIAAAIVFYIVKYYSERTKKKQTREKMEFFTNTAHDILTPLSLIEAPLKDISFMNTLTEEARYLLSLALNNTQKLSRFVYQLIDFQKISLNTRQLLVSRNHLQWYFTGKGNDYRPIASQKFITLDVHIPETEKEVFFDKEKVGKILDNLLSNAIKYTPFGGKIEINVLLAENEWSFTVKDTGPGISRKNQNLIFKYIFREKNDVNYQNVGSGVGLKMVHALVCIHHGEISFNSKKGEGTEFTITLPYVYDEKFIDTSGTVEFVRQDEKNNARIMVAVSDTEVASYLHNVLSHDYCVETCNTGTEACSAVTRIQPQLIVVDSQLSDMDGFSFCKRIKENTDTTHIPVVVITHSTDKETAKKIFASGAIDFIRKPFDSEALVLQTANLLTLQQVWQNKVLTDMKKSNITAVNNERDREFMDNLIQLIEQNLDNPDLNVSMLCSELALSHTLLYNRITQLTGYSPNEFIRIIRLKNASNMLITGKYTIAEVSTMVGIDNPKYFSRIFKDYYKVSPKNYLKET